MVFYVRYELTLFFGKKKICLIVCMCVFKFIVNLYEIKNANYKDEFLFSYEYLIVMLLYLSIARFFFLEKKNEKNPNWFMTMDKMVCILEFRKLFTKLIFSSVFWEKELLWVDLLCFFLLDFSLYLPCFDLRFFMLLYHPCVPPAMRDFWVNSFLYILSMPLLMMIFIFTFILFISRLSNIFFVMIWKFIAVQYF